MGTLDELKYYCDEENTFGALLLTGQWGCGKTYLIEHQLCEDSDMKKKFVFLRISLFGEPSIESIQKKVKTLYLSQKWAGESTAFSKIANPIKKAVDIVKDTGVLGDIGNAVLSINPTDFFEIENQIGDKKVVLIFDDFERCTINTVDLFGCINSYCENQGLKVIVIADEEKIEPSEKAEEQTLPYKDIKEKLITRTIHYEPEYDQIIKGIVGAYKAQSTEYKEFLNKNRNRICNVFNKNEIKNLRSLKCAIQDFERVYQTFKELDYMTKIDETFISFLTYVLDVKAGKIETSSHLGELARANPNERFLLDPVKVWAVSSKWDQEELEKAIKEKIEREKPMAPKDELKFTFLLDLDDETIHEGFDSYINEAYCGLLSLEEYITLIGNISFAKKIDYKFPSEIDYIKLENGINKCFSRLNKSQDETIRSAPIIADYDFKELPEEEFHLYHLYKIIRDYSDGNIQKYEFNKRKYIEALNAHDSKKLLGCESMRFNTFSREMANAVFEYYRSLPSNERRFLVYGFFEMWKGIKLHSDFRTEESRIGLNALLSKIASIRPKSRLEQYVDDIFIKRIETLISLLPQQQEKSNDDETKQNLK